VAGFFIAISEDAMSRVASAFALLIALAWGADRIGLIDWPPLWGLFLIFSAALLVVSLVKDTDEFHRIPMAFWAIAVLMAGALVADVVWDPSNLQPTATVAVGTLATIGWIVQRDSAMFLSRKQHTLTILMQMRHSEVFNRHRTNVLSRYPMHSNASAADIEALLRERDCPRQLRNQRWKRS
jgi:hypothetical protein